MGQRQKRRIARLTHQLATERRRSEESRAANLEIKTNLSDTNRRLRTRISRLEADAEVNRQQIGTQHRQLNEIQFVDHASFVSALQLLPRQKAPIAEGARQTFAVFSGPRPRPDPALDPVVPIMVGCEQFPTVALEFESLPAHIARGRDRMRYNAWKLPRGIVVVDFEFSGMLRRSPHAPL